MFSESEDLPDNLKVITNLLHLAFQRHLAKKQGRTLQKELEQFSNVSTTTSNVNNLRGTNNG